MEEKKQRENRAIELAGLFFLTLSDDIETKNTAIAMSAPEKDELKIFSQENIEDVAIISIGHSKNENLIKIVISKKSQIISLKENSQEIRTVIYSDYRNILECVQEKIRTF